MDEFLNSDEHIHYDISSPLGPKKNFNLGSGRNQQNSAK